MVLHVLKSYFHILSVHAIACEVKMISVIPLDRVGAQASVSWTHQTSQRLQSEDCKFMVS